MHDRSDRQKKNRSEDNTLALLDLGWTPHFQSQLEQVQEKTLTPARVVGVRKNSFLVSDGIHEHSAAAAGRLRRDAAGLYPVVGDWVLMKETMITGVMDRKNTLSRGASGTHDREDAPAGREQVIAANLDTVFIVCGLDQDFNLRRIERYLTLVYNCGLNPAIILTKADLHPDPEPFVRETEAVAFGVPVHLVSATDETGLAGLESSLSQGRTTTMIGSSGAGKSTLINRLCGREVQPTAAVGESAGKGRHTTTSRDLILLPRGGMVIDNPGIREIALWAVGDGAGAAFPDIETLGRECRFRNCSHTAEPGCRVLAAVEDGQISFRRLENYRKMMREQDYLSSRRKKSADRVEKERWKEVSVKIKAIKSKRSKS